MIERNLQDAMCFIIKGERRLDENQLGTSLGRSCQAFQNFKSKLVAATSHLANLTFGIDACRCIYQAIAHPPLSLFLSLSLSLSLSMSVSVSNHADGEQCWNLAAQHSSSWSTFLIANYPVSPRAPTSIRDILTVAKGPMLGSLCTVT